MSCCIICNHAASTGFTGNTKLAHITSLMIGTAQDTVRIIIFDFSGNEGLLFLTSLVMRRL